MWHAASNWPSTAPKRVRRAPLGVYLLIAQVAVYTGYFSVTLPLLMRSAGLSVLAIALVFTAIALSAGGANLFVLPRLLTRSPGLVVSVCAGIAVLGQLGMAAAVRHDPSWLVVGACVTMSSSMVFPLALGSLATTRVEEVAAVARARTVFVLGFAGGYLLVVLRAELQVTYTAVSTVVLIALTLSAPLCLRSRTRPNEPSQSPSSPQHQQGEGGGGATVLMTLLVSSVLLLKAGDSVRVSYFPIVISEAFRSETLVAVLYIVTLTAELGVLALLPKLQSRMGPLVVMAAVAVAGVVAFALLASSPSLAEVLVSSIVYAAFTAGFQSVGMVIMSGVFNRGLAHGAAVYTALVQFGSITGTLIPLLWYDLDERVFWGGATCSAIALVLLLVGLRFDRTSRSSASAVTDVSRAASKSDRAASP